MKKVCVFCGSRLGKLSQYASVAKQFALELVRRDCELVYGGAKVGIMGLIADEMLKNGARVTGVIPEQLADVEIAHDGLTELIVVQSMHERKAKMMELSDAFIALPGGFGTLEELCEVITWAQLGIHQKPIGLLNIESFYTFFLQQLNHANEQGFICDQSHRLLYTEEGVAELLDCLVNHKPGTVPRIRLDISES